MFKATRLHPDLSQGCRWTPVLGLGLGELKSSSFHRTPRLLSVGLSAFWSSCYILDFQNRWKMKSSIIKSFYQLKTLLSCILGKQFPELEVQININGKKETHPKDFSPSLLCKYVLLASPFFSAAGNSHTWEGMFYSGERNRQGPETLVNNKLILSWHFSSLWIFKMMKCGGFSPFDWLPSSMQWEWYGAKRFSIYKRKPKLKENLELHFNRYSLLSSIHPPMYPSICGFFCPFVFFFFFFGLVQIMRY